MGSQRTPVRCAVRRIDRIGRPAREVEVPVRADRVPARAAVGCLVDLLEPGVHVVRIRRVDDEELVVPALDSRSEPLAADALLQRGPGVGELRRLGNLRPGARDRAAVRDVDAVEVAVDRSGQLVQQGRRLVDRIELRAVSRVGKGHVADVLRVDGAGWVDQRPVVARTAVGGLVEAVVRVAAAPAGCRDQVARVLRVEATSLTMFL